MIIAVVAGLLAFLATRFRPGASRRVSTTTVTTVVCLALGAVTAAMASLNVALPDLARSTQATQTQLEWVIDAYSLVFAALLLPAGALGDRYGRRRVLIAGLVIFGGASAAAMTASSANELIALRAVIGLGAALVMPATLSTITSTFPPAERTRAVSVWAAVAGGSALLGLLCSGALLEEFSWRSAFAGHVGLARGGVLCPPFFWPGFSCPCAAGQGRCPARHGQPDRPGIQHHRSPRGRLGHRPHSRRDRRRGGRPGGLRRLGAALRPPDAGPAALPQPAPVGRQPVDLHPVLRVLRLHLRLAAVPAGRARQQPAGRRAVGAAAGGSDDAHRPDHPEPGRPLWRPRRLRHWADAGCSRTGGRLPDWDQQLLLAAAGRPEPARHRHGRGGGPGRPRAHPR